MRQIPQTWQRSRRLVGPLLFLAIFLAAAATFATAAASGDLRQVRSGKLEVIYGRGDEKPAAQARTAVEHAMERISRDLGITFVDPVTIRIVRGREEFDQACGRPMPEWAMAAAFHDESSLVAGAPGKWGGIVVDAARATPATANDLRLTVFHEVVHLALFLLEKDRADRLPLWFHEGLAQWLSGQPHLRIDDTEFTASAVRDALIPFDELETQFPTDKHKASLAYLQSAAFIEHLASTRSREVARWMLDDYRRGMAFAAAFEKNLGVSRIALEGNWREKRKSRFPQLRWIWEMITLTTVMALLTILAFLAIRWRSWRQHRRWKKEEEWHLVLPEDDLLDASESHDEEEFGDAGHYMD